MRREQDRVRGCSWQQHRRRGAVIPAEAEQTNKQTNRKYMEKLVGAGKETPKLQSGNMQEFIGAERVWTNTRLKPESEVMRPKETHRDLCSVLMQTHSRLVSSSRQTCGVCPVYLCYCSLPYRSHSCHWFRNPGPVNPPARPCHPAPELSLGGDVVQVREK